MPVCSYVVVPAEGSREDAARALGRIDGCEVHAAHNADVLLLVTSTPTFEADVALRRRIGEVGGVEALLMTFGEIDPETPVPDPIGAAKS